MRPVGVHLDEELGTLGQADPERVLVGAAKPKLARPVQDPHAGIGGGQSIRELAGAVGRGVVDDQDLVAEPADSGHHPLEVQDLVEGRQHHQHRIAHVCDSPVFAGARRPSLTPTTCRNMSIELRTAMTLVGAEFRQTTGTSAMRTPLFLARYRTSGS